MKHDLPEETYLLKTSSAPVQVGNIVTIQFLRGLAAWAVVFHHFMQVFFDFESGSFVGWFFATHGRLGVDVFFVISGFVMHHTLSRRSYTGTDFMLRRLIRIAPAYWVATLLLVLAASVGIVGAGYQFALWDIKTLLLSLGFVPHGHLSELGSLPVLTVGWTLNFEMFFYAVLAICLGLFGKHALLAAALILSALPFVTDSNWPWGAITASTLLFEFILGMLISVLFQQGTLLLQREGLSLLLGCVLLTLAGLYLAVWGPFTHFVVSTLSVMGVLLCESWVRRQSGMIVTLLSRAGDLSYSSYLYHPIVLFTLFNMFGTPESYGLTIGLLAITVVATTVLSIVSFNLVEQRLQRWIWVRLRAVHSAKNMDAS